VAWFGVEFYFQQSGMVSCGVKRKVKAGARWSKRLDQEGDLRLTKPAYGGVVWCGVVRGEAQGRGLWKKANGVDGVIQLDSTHK
jgi:hypothetical protein